jgi:hypothetical protein
MRRVASAFAFAWIAAATAAAARTPDQPDLCNGFPKLSPSDQQALIRTTVGGAPELPETRKACLVDHGQLIAADIEANCESMDGPKAWTTAIAVQMKSCAALGR